MASILEGARKYGLGLVLAHQTLRQVGSSDVVTSALANAYTRVCFRLGHEDARRLALPGDHQRCRAGGSGRGVRHLRVAMIRESGPRDTYRSREPASLAG